MSQPNELSQHITVRRKFKLNSQPSVPVNYFFLNSSTSIQLLLIIYFIYWVFIILVCICISESQGAEEYPTWNKEKEG